MRHGVGDLHLVATVKLLPSAEERVALAKTLQRCNEACSWLAARAFETKTFHKFALHKLGYGGLCYEFNLRAQAAVLCVRKVAQAYRGNRKTVPIFRPMGAQPYDRQLLRFADNGTAVNLWAVGGRITIPVIMGEHQRRLFANRKGQVDLCLSRGTWMLVVTCQVEEKPKHEAKDWLGVDLGIKSLAVDSDGIEHTGANVEKVRSRLTQRRAALQRRGTRAAKRRLRKLSGKEARYRRHTNHCIAKAIVSGAQRYDRGIALEELTGIRGRVKARRAQRSRLHTWAFRQLRSFIEYKAALSGIPVELVHAANTSIQCSCCGYVDNRNRQSQALFSCVSCGHSAAADHNAAINIRQRALVARASATAPDVPASRQGKASSLSDEQAAASQVAMANG